MDYSQLTDEELRTHLEGMNAELQNRNRTKQLLDRAHTLVMDARNAGFTKAVVAKALTDVVNNYYQ